MKQFAITFALVVTITAGAHADIPTRAYFGDTHLHTSFSPDAGMAGTTVGPEGAYWTIERVSAFVIS